MHKYIHTFSNTFIPIAFHRICSHGYNLIAMYIHTHTQICTHANMHLRTQGHMGIHTHTYTHTCTQTYTHTGMEDYIYLTDSPRLRWRQMAATSPILFLIFVIYSTSHRYQINADETTKIYMYTDLLQHENIHIYTYIRIYI